MYDAQGIQQQGRFFEISKESGIKPEKCCKGQKCKIGKNQSWKYQFKCQSCGKLTPGRSDGANRFCSNACQHQFVVNRWLKCSQCMAQIGIGSHTASRLLGVHASNISKKWKELGIVSVRPKSGSVVTEGKKIATKKREEQSRAWMAYERAWMEHEVKQHAKFPDWDSIWKSERAKIYSLKKYNSFSIEEKRKWNRRRYENKLKRWGENPNERKRDLAKYREWKYNNREKQIAYVKQSFNKRRKIDPGFKVVCNLRNRFREIMRSAKNAKGSGFSNLTGCTTNELRKHLESQFKSWMTWDNYGTKWHVDHIMPCAAFNQLDPRQRAQCWHYTNLRPLCAKKNIKKSSQIEDPQLSLLLPAC